MSKKLAIRGHSTRGKEVIELLEMMGGKNNCDSLADNLGLCYLINDEFDICAHYFGYDDYQDGGLNIFTLEEFLEKYPFKIGDKVIDKADGCPGIVNEMKWDEDVSDMKYCVVFGNGIDFGWFVNDSIEFCKNKNLDETKVESTGFMQVCKTAGIIFNDANYEDEVELQLGDYEIEVRDGRTFAVKKKPKYPKTFDECLNVLYCKSVLRTIIGHKAELLFNLEKLLICRDAYWKIAGDELGLGKPWEPDWKNRNQKKYCIYYEMDDIQIGSWYYGNCILAFPTKETRSSFYKNFKNLIKSCKELL